MPSGRAVGLLGAAAGLLTAGAGAAVARQRRRIADQRAARDPLAATPYGRLPSDRTCTVIADDGIALAVQEVGSLDAPLAVVLVHGYTLATGSWHYQRLALAGPDVRLVFYDQRSHGASQRGSAESAQLDQLASDLHAVIHATAGDHPVVLIGHSMGGMTILALAQARPELFGEQVRAVALLSTTTGALADVDLGLPRFLAPLKLLALPALARGVRAQPRLAELTRRTGSDLSWWLTRLYSFGDPEVSPALVDYVGALIASTPVDVIGEYFATLMGQDTVSALSALRGVPTLIVCGDKDRLTPLAHSAAMAAQLPDAELLVVQGGGHLAMMEHPDPVNDALLALLDRAFAAAADGSRR